MARSFKLLLSKVINRTLQSCRSTDPSDLPDQPVPDPLFRLSPNSKLITVDFPPVNQLTSRMKSTAGNHQLRRISYSDPTISSEFIRFYSTSREFKWEKEEKWHVIAKIYDEAHTIVKHRKKKASSSITKNVEQSALPPPVPTKPSPSSHSNSRRKKRYEKSKRIPINTFSPEFSNEVGDERSTQETETIVANYYINDSSVEYLDSKLKAAIRKAPTTSTRRHKKSKRKPKKRSTESNTHSIEIIHRQSSVSSTAAEMGSSPARLSMFKMWIPCSVDGKVKESFAFVKKSEDPYEDFKRSMMEMILEKQIFDAEELETLLQCFLSLNSTQYHILIFKAFSEVSETMFSGSSRNSMHHHRRVSSRS